MGTERLFGDQALLEAILVIVENDVRIGQSNTPNLAGYISAFDKYTFVYMPGKLGHVVPAKVK